MHSYWLDRALDFNQSSIGSRFPIGSKGKLEYQVMADAVRWYQMVCMGCVRDWNAILCTRKMEDVQERAVGPEQQLCPFHPDCRGTLLKTTTAPEENCATSLSSPR